MLILAPEASRTGQLTSVLKSPTPLPLPRACAEPWLPRPRAELAPAGAPCPPNPSPLPPLLPPPQAPLAAGRYRLPPPVSLAPIRRANGFLSPSSIDLGPHLASSPSLQVPRWSSPIGAACPCCAAPCAAVHAVCVAGEVRRLLPSLVRVPVILILLYLCLYAEARRLLVTCVRLPWRREDEQ